MADAGQLAFDFEVRGVKTRVQAHGGRARRCIHYGLLLARDAGRGVRALAFLNGGGSIGRSHMWHRSIAPGSVEFGKSIVLGRSPADLAPNPRAAGARRSVDDAGVRAVQASTRPPATRTKRSKHGTTTRYRGGVTCACDSAGRARALERADQGRAAGGSASALLPSTCRSPARRSSPNASPTAPVTFLDTHRGAATTCLPRHWIAPPSRQPTPLSTDRLPGSRLQEQLVRSPSHRGFAPWRLSTTCVAGPTLLVRWVGPAVVAMAQVTTPGLRVEGGVEVGFEARGGVRRAAIGERHEVLVAVGDRVSSIPVRPRPRRDQTVWRVGRSRSSRVPQAATHRAAAAGHRRSLGASRSVRCRSAVGS